MNLSSLRRMALSTVSLASAVACLPVFRSGREVSRAEGACFVLAYVVYLLSLLALGLLISTVCTTQQQAFATNFNRISIKSDEI